MSAIGPRPGGTFGQLVGRALVITLAALLGFTVAPAVAVQTAPDNLPGFDPETGPPPGYQPPPFTYPSPEAGLRSLPPPPDEQQSPEEHLDFEAYLNRLGDGRQYTAGTRAHFYARWRDRRGGRTPVTFEQYRDEYIRMHNGRLQGHGFEDVLEADLELRQPGWRLDQAVPGMPAPDNRRRPDAYHPDHPFIYEFKSGSESGFAPREVRQLEAYVRIARHTGKRVIYLFANPPSQKVLTQIARVNAGAPPGQESIVARVYPVLAQAVPIPEDSHAPPPPPSARPSNSPGTDGGSVPLAHAGQIPVDGALQQAVAGSPDSAEDAAARAEVGAELAAEFQEEFGDDVAVGTDPLAGVDFSTLELRYVSGTYRGEGAQFAFRLDSAPEDQPAYGGRRAARLASDSFFVWLALPEDAFTVNLNPGEPDRIIDSEFGRTDAGRVLLEADLELKTTTGELLDPGTTLGREFWDALPGDENCMSSRKWIVPAPATVHDTGDELFILDAPLEVKMEAEHLPAAGGIDGCPTTDTATQQRNEDVYRRMILPLVEEAVNEAPEYADLRRVYYSRVAAQWYRERSATERTAYSDIIDSGDISRWVSQEDWSPREVFDRYVESYTEPEFQYTYEDTVGNIVYTHTVVYGGVDFTQVPQQAMSSDEFRGNRPNLPQAVQSSLHGAAGEQDGQEVWLGGLTTTRPIVEIPLKPPPPPTGSPLFHVLIGAPVLAWLVAGGWLVARRRRRA